MTDFLELPENTDGLNLPFNYENYEKLLMMFDRVSEENRTLKQSMTDILTNCFNLDKSPYLDIEKLKGVHSLRNYSFIEAKGMNLVIGNN